MFEFRVEPLAAKAFLYEQQSAGAVQIGVASHRVVDIHQAARPSKRAKSEDTLRIPSPKYEEEDISTTKKQSNKPKEPSAEKQAALERYAELRRELLTARERVAKVYAVLKKASADNGGGGGGAAKTAADEAFQLYAQLFNRLKAVAAEGLALKEQIEKMGEGHSSGKSKNK